MKRNYTKTQIKEIEKLLERKSLLPSIFYFACFVLLGYMVTGYKGKISEFDSGWIDGFIFGGGYFVLLVVLGSEVWKPWEKSRKK